MYKNYYCHHSCVFQHLKVEAKNSAIQAKEAEYQLAEVEKQRLQDQLAQERLSREEEKYKMQEQLMLTKAQEQVGIVFYYSSCFLFLLLVAFDYKWKKEKVVWIWD